jgi:hypothetical protein
MGFVGLFVFIFFVNWLGGWPRPERMRAVVVRHGIFLFSGS